jgi:hypothetical protein
MKTFINFIKEAKWKIGDRIIPNPRYNKNDKWAKKHGVVTKILSGGKIEIKLDGEVLPTVLKSNEIIKEAYRAYSKDSSCHQYSQQEINDLEKFADRILKKWDIDIEFTKHFRDRMGDGRNHPCIKVGEMQDLFKKIEKRQGDKIKDYGKGQVVIIDMQKDLNLPVVINIKKNGEFEVIAKTVMRKKDYMTRNKRLKY